MDGGTLKVCIIGKGEIGSNIEREMKQKSIDTIYTIDIDLKKKPNFVSIIDFNNRCSPADVYILCVWTKKQVLEIVKEINCENHPLISIESACEVGTHNHVKKLVGEKADVVVFNERWNPCDFYHGVFNQNRVMGGDIKRGLQFYARYMMRENIITTDKSHLAELCKITENAYRYLEIAVAEQLKMLVGGDDFEELRRLCNSKWNIDIKEARDGIGGHCLPKDIKLFLKTYPNANIFRDAIEVNEKYKKQV